MLKDIENIAAELGFRQDQYYTAAEHMIKQCSWDISGDGMKK